LSIMAFQSPIRVEIQLTNGIKKKEKESQRDDK
jgi:hypothetical protein